MDASRAQEHTHKWLLKWRLLKPGAETRLVTERYSLLASRMFPDAGREQLQVISDFTAWLFVHDDVCDETRLASDPPRMREFFAHEMLLLQGHAADEPKAGPLDAPLRDLRDRFFSHSPGPGWKVRLLAAVQDYFDACVWEAENRGRGIVPPVDRYIAARRAAGAIEIYLHFIELCRGEELRFELRSARLVKRLHQICCNVVAWHNDLYSFEKERVLGDVHNLVAVLREELRLSESEAISRATNYCDGEVQSFLSLLSKRHPLEPSLDRLFVRHVEDLKFFIRGALDWAQESARYSAGHQAAV